VVSTQMNPIDAEKAKARRAQWFLYVLMGIMIVAPVAAFWLRSR
jgi:predicted membrane channel-forming protein YqfA (hemolysin III family)